MTPADPTKIFVTFWGTRGSISTPGTSTEKYGGNTPCISVRFEETDIILDAGTGIRNLGLELVQQAKEQNAKLDFHLFLSHTHWDHIQGLPFFAPAYMGDTKLAIYGSPKKGKFLEGILQGQMDINYFPVEMNALAADLSISEISKEKIQIGSVTVDWQEQVCHPGGSVRYVLNAAGKKVVYATDVELDEIFGSNILPPSRADKNPSKSNRTQSSPTLSGKPRSGSGRISMDSEEIKALAQEYCDFVRDADLLIADGQYTEEEYPFRAGWGHTSIPVILDIAHQQNIKQLAIFHHEPQHSDMMLDKLWSQYNPKYRSAKPSMNIFWAREGMTLAI